MSPIPNFKTLNNHPWGVLPEGVHACADDDEFISRFVTAFPDSESRDKIAQGFLSLKESVEKKGLNLLQWVDGSFVEGKKNPHDVDVVSFADYETMNLLNEEQQHFVFAITNRELEDFHTHSFFVISCPEEHPYHSTFEDSRKYWRRWFGQTRTGVPKGMVKISIGEIKKIPVISEEGGR